MPDDMKGAYVNCYVAAPDPESAMRKGVMAITQDNYIFEDIVNGVREIPIENWNEYIGKTWPEFVNHLPSLEQVRKCVEDEMVFFGPFMGFEG